MSNAIFMDSHLSAIISWFDVYLRIDIINVCSYKSKICKLYISGDLYIWRFGLKGTHSLQSEIYTARKKKRQQQRKRWTTGKTFRFTQWNPTKRRSTCIQELSVWKVFPCLLFSENDQHISITQQTALIVMLFRPILWKKVINTKLIGNHTYKPFFYLFSRLQHAFRCLHITFLLRTIQKYI